MKAHRAWSYAPYRPPFVEIGDVYINRVVPTENSIEIEWLAAKGEKKAYIRERGNGEFAFAGRSKMINLSFAILKTRRSMSFLSSALERKAESVLQEPVRVWER